MSRKAHGTPPAPAAAEAGRSQGTEAGAAALARGHYPTARRLLAAQATHAGLPEGERELARSLIAATRLERGAVRVALACLALFALVVAVTALKQP
jgi:hypothetical protein